MCLCRCVWIFIRLLALVVDWGRHRRFTKIFSAKCLFEPDSGPYRDRRGKSSRFSIAGLYFWCYHALGTALSEGAMAVFATGVLGSFTTMSAFAMDYLEFSEESNSTAVAYALVTIIGSIGLAWVGYRTTLELMS